MQNFQIGSLSSDPGLEATCRTSTTCLFQKCHAEDVIWASLRRTGKQAFAFQISAGARNSRISIPRRTCGREIFGICVSNLLDLVR
jgi:hypothetical protein